MRGTSRWIWLQNALNYWSGRMQICLLKIQFQLWDVQQNSHSFAQYDWPSGSATVQFLPFSMSVAGSCLCMHDITSHKVRPKQLNTKFGPFRSDGVGREEPWRVGKAIFGVSWWRARLGWIRPFVCTVCVLSHALMYQPWNEEFGREAFINSKKFGSYMLEPCLNPCLSELSQWGSQSTCCWGIWGPPSKIRWSRWKALKGPKWAARQWSSRVLEGCMGHGPTELPCGGMVMCSCAATAAKLRFLSSGAAWGLRSGCEGW